MANSMGIFWSSTCCTAASTALSVTRSVGGTSSAVFISLICDVSDKIKSCKGINDWLVALAP